MDKIIIDVEDAGIAYRPILNSRWEFSTVDSQVHVSGVGRLKVLSTNLEQALQVKDCHVAQTAYDVSQQLVCLVS